jgi:arylsulfatase A
MGNLTVKRTLIPRIDREHAAVMPPRLIALFIALASACVSSSAVSAERPNFIVINIDDLGYADIGPFGSKLNRTPRLDRMAAEGRKLTSFYAALVCSPSRAALMTGCYPKRVLPIPGVLFPAGAVGLNPAENTVADLLKTAGYATACIGKWHLGDQPEFLPTRQGFDYYLGIPYSNDMGPAAEGSKTSLGEKLRNPKAEQAGGDESGKRGSGQPPLPLLENEKVLARVGPDEQQSLVERYTTAAVKFIAMNKDRPFFLYLPHNAVHFPIYPGKSFQGKSPHGFYSDWVEEVDWSVGQVLDQVRTLNLAEKTLVIFTSDNGGTPRAVNTPLRGNKASNWEGGVRVPTIAWWPGKVPAATSSDAICGMFDILPTFVALAGGKVPADRKIDGADLWPVLAGDAKAPPPHETFLYYRGLRLDAVRAGDWKLHLAKGELYNLVKDIGEMQDVAAANPEVVQRLRDLAAATKDDLGPEEKGPGVRELGRVSSPQPLIGADGKARAGFE